MTMDCNFCIHLTYDEKFQEWKCEKGRDPYCQMRKNFPCLLYESVSKKMGKN